MTKLDEIRARAEAATAGPWHIGHISEIHDDVADIDSFDGAVADNVYGSQNLAFLVHARTDIPLLLEVIKIYEEALDAVCDCDADEALDQARKLLEGKTE